MAGEAVLRPFEEQMLRFAFDDDGIAVSGKALIHTGRRTEVADRIDQEDAAVLPDDGAGLHVSRGIKVGVDFHIDSLRTWWFCIGHIISSFPVLSHPVFIRLLPPVRQELIHTT